MSMMDQFSFGFINPSSDSGLYSISANFLILCTFSIVICIFGLIGNGIFLWLLTFNIKRNIFTMYLLNFSTASFGFLLVAVFIYAYAFLSIIGIRIDTQYVGNPILLLLSVMQNSCQFILVIIGIDRCVSVLYPSWYRCHKSSNFPTFFCFLIWVFSLMSGILFILHSKGPGDYNYYILLGWLLGPFILCFPVVTVSTLTLFIKGHLKSQPEQRGGLTTAILLTLLLFLLLDAFAIITVIIAMHTYHVILLVWCVYSLVSSLNPLIYFLVGRRKGKQVQASMKVVLQRVFKEEEPGPANQHQLQFLH